MPCSTASTMCPRPVDRVFPEIVAVACDFHHGAASPARAGTHSTPPLSDSATASISAAPLITPSEVSHLTADAAV